MKKIILLFIASFTFISNAQIKSTGTLTFVPGLTGNLELNSNTSTIKLTLIGPSDRWIAFKFGNFSKAMGPTGTIDGVYYDGTTLVDGNGGQLGSDGTGSVQSWTVVSNDVAGSVRTIVATRAFSTAEVGDYPITFANSDIDVAAAQGATPSSYVLAAHGPTNRKIFINTPLNNVLSVEDFSLNASTIGPNPAKGSFTIQSKTGIDNVEIYTHDGRFVKKITIAPSSNTEVTVEGLSQGVYMMLLKNDNDKSWKKVIVN
jgi:hypothetical protein